MSVNFAFVKSLFRLFGWRLLFMIVYFCIIFSLNHPHKEWVSFVELHETVLDVLD